MAKKSATKYIGRNRAPRVHIEYETETGGAERAIELPFIMGVMADLSGKSNAELPSINDRKFLEIDADNFDDRLKAMKPRVQFAVPNALTGDGNLSVDITFESLDDFSPEAVARKVGVLDELLTARKQLENLVTFMDGKSNAEDLIANALNDPELLKKLVNSPNPEAKDADA